MRSQLWPTEENNETRGRVVLVGRRPLWLEALRELIQTSDDFSVVGIADNAMPALQIADDHGANLVVVGIHSGDSINDLVDFRRFQGKLRVIVLSDSDEPANIMAAVEAGANAYLLTVVSRDDFIGSLKSVMSDPDKLVLLLSKTPISVHDTALPKSSGAALTLRELEVVALAGEALTNAQIARRINLTEGTVKRHLHNIFRKLGAVSRLDAVRKAQLARLVPLTHV